MKNTLRVFVPVFFFVLAFGASAPLASAAITALNLTSPDGAEMWRGMRDITWTTTIDINGGNDLSLLISNDGGSTYTTLVGVIPFTPGTYSWNTIPTIDGNLYKIRVHNPQTGAFDSSTFNFRVDNTPPTTSITIPAPTGLDSWYTVAPTITLTCSDGTGSGCFKTYYRWDSNPYVEYPGTITASEGVHVLSWYSEDQAVDASGIHNVETVQTQTIKVDTIVPTVAVTSTTFPGAYNAGEAINVTLTFSEAASSTAPLLVTLNTGGTCSIPTFSNQTIVSCPYTVGAGENSSGLIVSSLTGATVEDIAGNDSTLIPTSNIETLPFPIVIDTTAPALFAVGTVSTSGGNIFANYWNSTNTGVNVLVSIANDSSLVGGTMQLQANVGAGYVNVGPANEILVTELGFNIPYPLTDAQLEAISGFSDGDSITFTAIITDRAGNVTTGTPSATILFVDQTPPSVNAGTDKIVNALVPQDATTSDVAGSGLNTYAWTQTVGGGATVFSNQSGTTPTIDPDTNISAVTEGVRTLRLTVTDIAGNSFFDDMQFVWDTTLPAVVLSSATPDPTNGMIFVVAQFSETVTGFDQTDIVVVNGVVDSFVAVDGDTYNFNVNPTDGASVAVTIDVPMTTSTDAAGNANTASNQITRTSDTVAPAVSSITTTDANLDGMVDTVTIVFNENVKDMTFSASDFMIGGVQAITAMPALPINDNTLIFSHAGVAGTNAKVVTYVPGITPSTDLAGNILSGFSQTSIDAAKPVLLSARTNTTTTIDLTFSENLNGVTVTNADFSVAGYTLGAPDAFEVTPGVVRLTVTVAFGTGDTPDVTMSGPVVEDLPGNAAVVPVTKDPTDGVAPVLTVVSISSSNDLDLIAPEWAKVGDIARIVFTASEPIALPVVTIAGRPATSIEGPLGNSWAANLNSFDGTETNGVVSFSIAFADMATIPNTGTPVTATGDGSFVFFDSVNPTVNAGIDREVNATVSQNATVSDPVPASGIATYLWAKQSGPGTITFNPVAGDTEDVTITASVDGTYVLRLTVTDNAGNVNSDEMTFIWDTKAPFVTNYAPTTSEANVPVAAGTAIVVFNEKIVLLDTAKVALVNNANETSVLGTPAVLGGNGNSPTLNLPYSALANGTTYRANVHPEAVRDVAGNIFALSFANHFTTEIDVTPPGITNIQTTFITQTGATITWNTNELATSRVEYGLTSAYGSLSAVDATADNTSHSVALTGLTADTMYHFRVLSTDALGNAGTSVDGTFMSLTPAPDTATPPVPLITTGVAIVNSDSYQISGIAGADTPSPTVRTISVYNGATLAGTAVVPVGQTGWSVSVTLTQSSTNSFTAISTDAAGNVSAASTAVIITEDAAVGTDTTAPDAPIITTTATTVDNDTYEITGTEADDGAVRNVSVYKSGVVVGTDVLPAGQTTWSVTITLAQNTTNAFTANAIDESGNTSAASNQIIITEATATPVTPTVVLSGTVIVSAYSATEAATRFASGLQFNVTNDSTVTVNGTTVPSVLGIVSADTLAGAITLGAHTYNIIVTSSTGHTANITLAYQVNADPAVQGNGELAVTSIDTIRPFATADNTFNNGWKWTFRVTVPTTETQFAMKFADFVSGANVLPAATNIRYLIAQSSTASTTASAVTIAGANAYPASITLDSDANTSVAGRQIEVMVEVRVPVGTAGGSYSTSYGVASSI